MSISVLNRFPKPIVFALLGALGALAGAVPGELVLIPTSTPTSNAADPGAATPRSVITFSPEVQERLDREGAEAGEIELALSWGNTNDLDLHCITPSGEHIWFQNKRSSDSGYLDVDMNVAASRASSKPIEHIRWKSGNAPPGQYRIYVHHFNRHVAGSDPTDYTVEIKQADHFDTVTGSLTRSSTPVENEKDLINQMTLVHTFDFSPLASPEPAPQTEEESGGFLMVFLVGLWTGLLAVGTGIGLVKNG